jgi:hypothetical protein
MRALEIVGPVVSWSLYPGLVVGSVVGLSAGGVQPRAVRDQRVWPWCEHRAATCSALRGWQTDGGV